MKICAQNKVMSQWVSTNLKKKQSTFFEKQLNWWNKPKIIFPLESFWDEAP